MSKTSGQENKEAADALTERQREILKIVVEEYINGAAPVGSATVRAEGQIGVSTATIRNELATLEELGYLYQPHTSAGRIPSIKGYRYFVEQLMERVELPVPEQRMIMHQFHQLQLNLEQWMRLAAAILAHNTQAASLVTALQGKLVAFKHLELILINDMLVLLIVVLQDSSIHQEMLAPADPITQDELSAISNKLNNLLGSGTLAEINAKMGKGGIELQKFEASVLQHVLQLMKQCEESWTSAVYSDGLENILREPEFVESGKFNQVVRLLQQRQLLETLLGRLIDAAGVQIIIGGEGDYASIDDVSLVLSPYGIRGQASGVLGVIGPTRMAYGRAISTVRYMAQLMDNLLTTVYGGDKGAV